jgi:hypothetical protein
MPCNILPIVPRLSLSMLKVSGASSVNALVERRLPLSRFNFDLAVDENELPVRDLPNDIYVVSTMSQSADLQGTAEMRIICHHL